MSAEDTVVTPAVVTPAAVVPAPAVVVTPVTPAVPAPALAVDDAQTDPNWFKPRLAREREKAIKEAGFQNVEDAKAAAKALHDQREAEKATAQKLAEAQTVFGQLKTRADSITALLTEQANESFSALTDAQKTAVRLSAADDAPAEDRIKAIRMVRAMAATITPAAPVTAPVTITAPATPITVVVPVADTAPPRTAPTGGTGTETNHRAVYLELDKTNPFEAAKYATAHPEAYKTA